jgi:hypothetical protein
MTQLGFTEHEGNSNEQGILHDHRRWNSRKTPDRCDLISQEQSPDCHEKIQVVKYMMHIAAD